MGGGGGREAVRTIRFGSYNIRNIRNGGLESALWRVSQANVDLVVLKEANITGIIYTR